MEAAVRVTAVTQSEDGDTARGNERRDMARHILLHTGGCARPDSAPINDRYVPSYTRTTRRHRLGRQNHFIILLKLYQLP